MKILKRLFPTTSAQRRELVRLGFNIVDILFINDTIECLRRKNIIIYNTAAPFVDPIKGRIVYSYTVKVCNTEWGWNCRNVIGKTKWSKDPYAMQRQAIWIVIRYLKKKQKQKNGRK